MKRTLTRVSPLQCGKIIGALHALMSLMAVPFFLLFSLLGGVAATQDSSGPPALVFIAAPLVLMVLAPLLYGVMGFIVGAVGALAYNLLARLVGGLEIEVE